MSKADFRFHTRIRVRWMECDAQGIVFNGSYLNYLEVGQAEYFRNLGFSIYRIAQRGYFDSAVVTVTVEYKAPARVEDDLNVFVAVTNIGNTSLTLEVEIYPESPRSSGQLLTAIHAVYVGYDASTGETRSVPDDIRRLINHFESTGEVLSLDQFPELAKAAG